MEASKTRIVSQTLLGILIFTLLFVLIAVGYIEVFPERDNAALQFVRFGGISFSIFLMVMLSIRGKLLKHIVDNW